MTDILNANEELPQESLADNSIVAEPQAEVAEAEAATTEESKKSFTAFQTKEEIFARIKELTEGDESLARQELDYLKSSFYRIQKQEAEEAYKQYVDEGGNPDAYLPAVNNDENLFKEQMNVLRDRRAQQQQEVERQKEENYTKKLAIIEKIKAILANPDEVNKSYNDFKELQQQWNEIKEVPADKATDLWKTYQVNVEQFYDTLKLNNEFRAYDFKKNLELKTALCEAVEKLADEEDVVSAFHQLQQFHQQFREIGPVARELREEVWTRFKAASTVVNKRHQDYFEERKQKEQENLDQKTAICETIEGMDLSAVKTSAEWNTLSEQVTELQAKWKTIGFAPQKMNVKIYERFRAACNDFFQKKSDFYRNIRENYNNNLKLKTELCEKAEALKDSTAWKETTEALVALQKRWREIGAVPKKNSEEIWARFNAACDAFFDAKKAANSSQNSEQAANLKSKKAIVERLAAIVPEEFEGDLRATLRKAQEEWNEIGHVPFKEKDKVYKLLREQMDRLYGYLSTTARSNRVDRFKNEVKQGGGEKLRDKLARQYDILKNEIKTYENNLGFLSLSSKSKQGNALVDELNRKVEKLRADLDEIKQKIAVIDAEKK